MKKLKSITKLVLLISITGLFLAACSSDDAPAPPQPSRIISKISIYKTTNTTAHFTDMQFDYDNSNRLTRIYSNLPLTTVNYAYTNTSKVSYSYATESTPLIEASASLKNGRCTMCTFSNMEDDATYSYYENGCLKSNSNNGVQMDYTWSNNNLRDITTTPRGTYNSQYTTSTVPNDYSFDLNTLAQLIDDRTNYTIVMNTYGQMAGILGNRSANIVQDTYYQYDYSFYQDGRLKDLSLKGPEETYTFKITYTDTE
ncbi:hypothetical protein [Phocaeicola sp.]